MQPTLGVETSTLDQHSSQARPRDSSARGTTAALRRNPNSGAISSKHNIVARRTSLNALCQDKAIADRTLIDGTLQLR